MVLAEIEMALAFGGTTLNSVTLTAGITMVETSLSPKAAVTSIGLAKRLAKHLARATWGHPRMGQRIHEYALPPFVCSWPHSWMAGDRSHPHWRGAVSTTAMKRSDLLAHLNAYPRVALAEYPTPLEPLPRLGAELGRRLVIKRDDEIGPALGGNKTRKFVAGAALSLVLLVLAWGLGFNLALGRLARPSTGAVDNGAACAVVAGLAERLAREGGLRRTAVILAFFIGEEANMQGSRAYVGSRSWPLPAAVFNLELLGQNGGYVTWERDGTGFRLFPASTEVTARLAAAVQEITGQLPQLAGVINSDGASSLARGIPTAVLGTRDQVWSLAGFHRPSDNLDRVDLARLPESVGILARFVRRIDEENLALLVR